MLGFVPVPRALRFTDDTLLRLRFFLLAQTNLQIINGKHVSCEKLATTVVAHYTLCDRTVYYRYDFYEVRNPWATSADRQSGWVYPGRVTELLGAPVPHLWLRDVSSCLTGTTGTS